MSSPVPTSIESKNSLSGSPKQFTFAVIVVTLLFFLWGTINNLLPSFVPKIQEGCHLNDFQASLVAAAFWSAYFIMPMPAAMLMRRFGYKGGICLGLVLGAIGCVLYYTAASVLVFPLFLMALFVLASGMAFLESAANPYISILGSPETAARRLNMAQMFNGIAAFVASFWLSKIILGKPTHTAEKLAEIKLNQPQEYLSVIAQEAKSVQPMFIALMIIFALAALVFFVVKLPDTKEHQKGESEIKEDKMLLSQLLKNRYFLIGLFAQFCYVGAQVGVDDFALRYIPEVTGLPKFDATTYLGLMLGCFMLGRIVGTSLMSVVSARTLLGVFAIINVALLLYSGFAKHYPAEIIRVSIPKFLMLGDNIAFSTHPAPYVLMAVKFFMSIMFPTIFSLSIQNVGKATKLASMLLIMSIVGGAVFSPIMGFVATEFKIFSYSYLVPMLCMIPILWLAFSKPPVAEKL